MQSSDYFSESGLLYSITDNVTSKISLFNYSEYNRGFLFDLFKIIKIDELDAWGWPQSLLDQVIEVQFNAFNQHIKNNFPSAKNFIIQFNYQPAGNILIDETSETILVLFIAISPEFRNNGIASEVINRIIKFGESVCKNIQLNVSKNNKALSLYASLGFKALSNDDISYLMEYRSTNNNYKKEYLWQKLS